VHVLEHLFCYVWLQECECIKLTSVFLVTSRYAAAAAADVAAAATEQPNFALAISAPRCSFLTAAMGWDGCSVQCSASWVCRRRPIKEMDSTRGKESINVYSLYLSLSLSLPLSFSLSLSLSLSISRSLARSLSLFLHFFTLSAVLLLLLLFPSASSYAILFLPASSDPAKILSCQHAAQMKKGFFSFLLLISYSP
jgi:hypothetical protein